MTSAQDDLNESVLKFMAAVRQQAQPMLHGTTDDASAAFDSVLDLIGNPDLGKGLTPLQRYWIALASTTQTIVKDLPTRGGSGLAGIDIDALASLDQRTAELMSAAAHACLATSGGEFDTAQRIFVKYGSDEATRWPFAHALGYVLNESIRRR